MALFGTLMFWKYGFIIFGWFCFDEWMIKTIHKSILLIDVFLDGIRIAEL